ncbi:alpha/beta hydrolase [Flavobacterium salilacus subsp. salilacus]|uniref:alpha/beta hydrolase n=1 Tax=Flavobacterium TaxID=237 RepID=UPI0010755AE4|nr:MULTISPECIES: alpha/beta fold hydrolase [Flavobacterium]KAF2519413.1 alpha/beta hydrolase [Flavobacterium salilacus subsp. salilacus]MBE1614695.1 alpha/beta hydrolase [Flavobacterium sp. SaA2.13]
MQKVFTYLLTKLIGLYINIISYISPDKARKLAYKFFSEPREGRLTTELLPKILQEAEAEMVTHNEYVFQMYTWLGGSKKILLVHGWESNSSRWEQFIPYLQKENYTIVALDAPAHGLSSGKEFNIPRYAEFINIIINKIQPAYMVGHSVGGATAIYYQWRYQSNFIKKMVVLGAPSDLNTLLANYRGLLSLNNNVSLLLEKHFIEHFKIKPQEFSGSLFASAITIPGLLAHDTEDEVVDFTEGEKIAQAWQSAEFIVTQGLKHSMHDEGLYHKICAFLSEE